MNLRGKPYQHHDTAGLVISMGRNPATGADEAFDFKGNLLRSTRQLVRDYKTHARLVAESGAGSRDLHQQHPLRRPQPPVTSVPPPSTKPACSIESAPATTKANLLERVDVRLRDAAGGSDRRALRHQHRLRRQGPAPRIEYNGASTSSNRLTDLHLTHLLTPRDAVDHRRLRPQPSRNRRDAACRTCPTPTTRWATSPTSATMPSKRSSSTTPAVEPRPTTTMTRCTG